MNYIDDFLEKLSSETDDIYLFGAGKLAGWITPLLEKKGIDYNGYIVDKQYLPADRTINGKRVITADELERDAVVIIAVETGGKAVDLTGEHIKKVYQFDWIASIPFGCHDDSFLTEHGTEFLDLYGKLGDFESKASLISFFCQRFTGEFHKQRSFKPQYYDETVIKPRADEVFVDCGAYNGDSLKGFIDFLKRNGIETFEKCIAFEPDGSNFEELKKNFAGYDNVEVYNLATFDRKCTLHFDSGNGTGSSIEESGSTEIGADTIDNIVNGGKVTYIKMDVEGAELSTLKGAKETIKKYKPRLAVCVYHKLEDILEIPQYILSLDPSYRLYMRNYESFGLETVLYAV